MNKPTLNIYELLDLNFFVPSYQRGYRWTEQQVEDLLQDIFDFINKEKEKGEYYCLQPVVVEHCDEETIQQHRLSSELKDNTWYEVIDGQQRLTTLHIILTYLKKKLLNDYSLHQSEYKKRKNTCEFLENRGKKFVIEYETRKNTRHFLENISDDYENIDCEYIYKAYQTVKNWFNKLNQSQEVGKKFMYTLLNDDENGNSVKVIWYEHPTSNSSNSIDFFTRLNIGKIPLTNAELVKALFLQKRNFMDDEANLRQIEIAKEWDDIENALHRENFWAFLNKEDNKSHVRIEFLFDMMYQIDERRNNMTKKNHNTDKYATFRYFSEKFTPNPTAQLVLNTWEEVKSYFATFQDWYENNEWYHYIGYLIWEGSTPIIELYEDYIKNNKSTFTKTLKNKVKKSIQKIKYTQEGSKYMLTNTYEKTNKRELRALFLLYNIEFILQKNANYYRFPFDLFKSEKWDIEHISSQTENTLKDKKSQDEWLKTALEALEKKEKEEYKALEKKEREESGTQNKNFEVKRNWIVNKVGEDDIDESLKNAIGNLTLLNAPINRSYGNNIFPAKRKIIMKKDQEGAFIPICTKNVFLKYHTGGNNLRWNEQDILSAMQHMVEILKDYLTKTDE